MNPSDPVPFLAALAAVAAFAITLMVLYRVRSAAQRKEAVQASRQGEAERAAANERRRREAELEKAVVAGTHLADGRPRCQASLCCLEAATLPKPRIVRDEGVTDFVRRAFGAPRRYRMVEADVSETGGLLGVILMFFRAAWSGEPKETSHTLRYCDVHVHIARQVCLEQLAGDEHAEMIAHSDREARLVYFESAGLEKRVIKVVSETEMRDADKKPRRGKSAEADKTNVVPFGRANGTSNNAGLS